MCESYVWELQGVYDGQPPARSLITGNKAKRDEIPDYHSFL